MKLIMIQTKLLRCLKGSLNSFHQWLAIANNISIHYTWNMSLRIVLGISCRPYILYVGFGSVWNGLASQVNSKDKQYACYSCYLFDHNDERRKTCISRGAFLRTNSD